jgi:hypothetical protein
LVGGPSDGLQLELDELCSELWVWHEPWGLDAQIMVVQQIDALEVEDAYGYTNDRQKAAIAAAGGLPVRLYRLTGLIERRRYVLGIVS